MVDPPMPPNTEKSDISTHPGLPSDSNGDLHTNNPLEEPEIGPGCRITDTAEEVPLVNNANGARFLLRASSSSTPDDTHGSVEREDPQTPSKPRQSGSENFKPLTAITSTPFRSSTQNQVSEHEEMKQILFDELGGGDMNNMPSADPGWESTLYFEQAPESKIREFLNEKSCYSRGRWNDLPKSPGLESQVQGPMFKIIASILEEFKPESSTPGVSRKAVDTHTTFFKHDNVNHNGTSPDISIKATGPSFELPDMRSPRSVTPSQTKLKVGWSNVTAVFEIKRESALSPKDNLKQVAGYCRQIFIHQPNRLFVRALLITEETVYLVHFDRSGVYLSRPINIHKDPYTFVRLVVGLSSCDEHVLGLDTSVSWTVDRRTGRKVSGKVRAQDSDGSLIEYEICMAMPPFVRATIRGRGTVCYRAIHPKERTEVIIKDSWRTDTRFPESTFLKAGKDIDGVVKILAYEDNCGETRFYRHEDKHPHPSFHNRIKSRIVMSHCTGPLDTFTTRFQLIAALRDAIQAHHELWLLGILHRDISIRNILLGDPNPEHVGQRGILIDFDMAIWMSRTAESVSKDPRSGAQRWQSIATLRNRIAFAKKKLDPPAADHLDDLESFFYVLCFLVLIFEGIGPDAIEDYEEMFVSMDLKNPDAALGKKGDMIKHHYELSAWWGKPCERLVATFQELIREIDDMKSKILNTYSMSWEERREDLSKIGQKDDGHHERIIAAFDQALEDIKRDDLLKKPAQVTEGRANLKRSLAESLPAEVSNAKRKARNVRWTTNSKRQALETMLEEVEEEDDEEEEEDEEEEDEKDENDEDEVEEEEAEEEEEKRDV